jgi:hypothetical protein
MDDEATRLLREIRELLDKAATRDSEWMDEQRRMHEESTQR